MKPIVLFVDDEANLLQSIRRLLRAEEYMILTATDGKEALHILEKEPVSVVVTDLKMPRMDGMTFLEEANTLYPDPLYILCSGHADIKTVMTAFNKKYIWHFIAKPWFEEDFKITLRNAIDFSEAKASNQKLLASLQKKNSELEQWNRELEAKVEERTQHLTNEKDILSMILQDASLVAIIHKICTILDTLITPATISITVPFLQRRFYQKREEFLERLSYKEEDAFQSQQIISAKDALYIPLVKDSITVGVAAIETTEQTRSYSLLNDEICKSYLYLLELALFQEKSLQEIPDIEASIEKLLGEL